MMKLTRELVGVRRCRRRQTVPLTVGDDMSERRATRCIVSRTYPIGRFGDSHFKVLNTLRIGRNRHPCYTLEHEARVGERRKCREPWGTAHQGALEILEQAQGMKQAVVAMI
jgi:hypothetical protein